MTDQFSWDGWLFLLGLGWVAMGFVGSGMLWSSENKDAPFSVLRFMNAALGGPVTFIRAMRPDAVRADDRGACKALEEDRFPQGDLRRRHLYRRRSAICGGRDGLFESAGHADV
jgi:hypothetical protein